MGKFVYHQRSEGSPHKKSTILNSSQENRVSQKCFKRTMQLKSSFATNDKILYFCTSTESNLLFKEISLIKIQEKKQLYKLGKY